MSKNEVESEILRELQNLALDENLVDQFATIVRNSLEVWSIKEVVALIQNLETLFVNPEAISPSKKIAVLDALVAVSRWRMSNMSQSERAAASPLMSPETAAPGGAELCEENASDSRNYSLKSQEFKSPDSKSPDSKSPDYRSPDFKSPDSKSPDHRSPDRPVGPPDDLPLDMIESTGAKTPKDAGLNLEQYDNQGLKLDINNLIKQKRLHLAQAESYDPTDVLEVKQILSALGIPFMHAPTEAEAQCAYFVSNGVVDAVITEDSDVLLFGGTNIYKNFFKRNQDIEMYSHKKIKESLDMNRFDLICMAYLLGSDYAEGVHGIGAFTASLIVKSWKEEGLEKIKRFKEWHESSESCKQHLPNSDILAKRCKTVHLPKNLCDPEVQDAYLNPEVDTNMKEFSWGCANIPAVYELLLEKSLDAGTIESIITQLQNISERREDIP